MLDGSESQYSGMQIGTLQDEEEEGMAPAPEEAPESFAHSVLGRKQIHVAHIFMQCTHAGYIPPPPFYLNHATNSLQN